MENAVKALYIVAGVLLGVMILSLGVVLFTDLQNYIETTREKNEFHEQSSFNAQFTKYINYIEDGDGNPDNNKQFTLTIQDVVTAAGLAYEINSSYNPDIRKWIISPDSLYVAVYNENFGRVDNGMHTTMLMDSGVRISFLEFMLTTYKDQQLICSPENIVINPNTGRVQEIHFKPE